MPGIPNSIRVVEEIAIAARGLELKIAVSLWLVYSLAGGGLFDGPG